MVTSIQHCKLAHTNTFTNIWNLFRGPDGDRSEETNTRPIWKEWWEHFHRWCVGTGEGVIYWCVQGYSQTSLFWTSVILRKAPESGICHSSTLQPSLKAPKTFAKYSPIEPLDPLWSSAWRGHEKRFYTPNLLDQISKLSSRWRTLLAEVSLSTNGKIQIPIMILRWRPCLSLLAEFSPKPPKISMLYPTDKYLLHSFIMIFYLSILNRSM